MAEENNPEDEKREKDNKETERFASKYGVRIDIKSFRKTFKSYFDFAKKTLPRVKHAMEQTKVIVQKAANILKKNREIIKKLNEAVKKGKHFSGRVYNACYAALLKIVAKKVGNEIQTQKQGMETALKSGTTGPKNVIVDVKAEEIPSRMISIPARKNNNKKKKGKNKPIGAEQKNPTQKNGIQEIGAKAKKKIVAENPIKANTSQQQARAVKVKENDVSHQREQVFRLGNALKVNQEQGRNRQEEVRKQEEIKRKRENEQKKEEARRNEKLAAEREKRQKLEEEDRKKREQERKQEKELEEQNKETDKAINELASRHNQNNVRREKLNSLREKIRHKNKVAEEDKANQTMVLDGSQNNKVSEQAKEQVKEAKKEVEKVINEVKSEVKETKKQTMNHLKELRGQDTGGVLKNDLARVSQNLDVKNMAPEMQEKIKEAQEDVNNRLNEIDSPAAAKGKGDKLELRPNYMTEDFKNKWKEKDARNGEQQSESENSEQEEKTLSPEEVAEMMRMGVNLNDKAQRNRFEMEKNKNHSSDGQGRTINMQEYAQQKYMQGGKRTG